jgi:hypothetical protein
VRVLLIDHEGDSLIFSGSLSFRLHTVEYGQWAVEAEIFEADMHHTSILSWHDRMEEADFVRDALVLEYVRALKIGSPLCMLSAADLNSQFENEEDPRAETQDHPNTEFELSALMAVSQAADFPPCGNCGKPTQRPSPRAQKIKASDAPEMWIQVHNPDTGGVKIVRGCEECWGNMGPCGVCNDKGCPECEPEPDPRKVAWWSLQQGNPGEITKVEITGPSQCMVCQDKGCVVCQGRGGA